MDDDQLRFLSILQVARLDFFLKMGGGLIFECFDIPLTVQYISTPTINHLSTLVPSQS